MSAALIAAQLVLASGVRLWLAASAPSRLGDLSGVLGISTPFNSPLELLEGAAAMAHQLPGGGATSLSPYSDLRSTQPPLLLWLHARLGTAAVTALPSARRQLLLVSPNVVCDCAAAVLLAAVAWTVVAPLQSPGKQQQQRLSSRQSNALTKPPQPPYIINSATNIAGGAAVGKNNTRQLPSPPPAALPALLSAMYLFNPLTVSACVAGTTSPVEGAFVLLAACAASRWRNLPLAAFALACAAYVGAGAGVHLVLLAVPVALLLCDGPERPEPALAAARQPVLHSHGAGAARAKVSAGWQAAAGITPAASGVPSAAAMQRPLPEEQLCGYTLGRQQTTGGNDSAPLGGGRAGPKTRSLATTAAALLLFFALWSWGLVLASDAVLSATGFSRDACLFPLPPVHRHRHNSSSSGYYRYASPAAAATASEAPHQERRRAYSLRGDSGVHPLERGRRGCWAAFVHRSALTYSGPAPTIGQWWYLFATAVGAAPAPDGSLEQPTGGYFSVLMSGRLLALTAMHLLPVLLVVPLAVRFRRRPLFLLLCQLLLGSALRPYPCASDLALALCVLPPFQPQLAHVQHSGGGAVALLLAASLPVLSALLPATWREWAAAEAGGVNANHLYGVCLLSGLWHLTLLAALLKASLKLEWAAQGRPVV